MKKFKKIVLLSLLTIFLGAATSSLAYCAESLEDIIKSFRQAQSELKEMKKIGAPEEKILAQQKKMEKLRIKISKIMSDIGL